MPQLFLILLSVNCANELDDYRQEWLRHYDRLVIRKTELQDTLESHGACLSEFYARREAEVKGEVVPQEDGKAYLFQRLHSDSLPRQSADVPQPSRSVHSVLEVMSDEYSSSSEGEGEGRSLDPQVLYDMSQSDAVIARYRSRFPLAPHSLPSFFARRMPLAVLHALALSPPSSPDRAHIISTFQIPRSIQVVVDHIRSPPPLRQQRRAWPNIHPAILKVLCSGYLPPPPRISFSAHNPHLSLSDSINTALPQISFRCERCCRALGSPSGSCGD
jgi:hypothetical protein